MCTSRYNRSLRSRSSLVAVAVMLVAGFQLYAIQSWARGRCQPVLQMAHIESIARDEVRFIQFVGDVTAKRVQIDSLDCRASRTTVNSANHLKLQELASMGEYAIVSLVKMGDSFCIQNVFSSLEMKRTEWRSEIDSCWSEASPTKKMVSLDGSKTFYASEPLALRLILNMLSGKAKR